MNTVIGWVATNDVAVTMLLVVLLFASVHYFGVLRLTTKAGGKPKPKTPLVAMLVMAVCLVTLIKLHKGVVADAVTRPSVAYTGVLRFYQTDGQAQVDWLKVFQLYLSRVSMEDEFELVGLVSADSDYLVREQLDLAYLDGIVTKREVNTISASLRRH